MQEQLLKTMTDRLRRWRYKGTWDARRELYELLSAASAALKAQYFRSTNGLDTEAGAEKAAKKAVLRMGKTADAHQRHQMAIRAAEMYMNQDEERKKSILMIDEAIDMLGPIEKVKGNKNIESSVENVKKIIELSKKKPEQFETDACNAIIDRAFARLTGKDPYAEQLKNHKNPFLGTDSEPSQAMTEIEKEAQRAKEKAEEEEKKRKESEAAQKAA